MTTESVLSGVRDYRRRTSRRLLFAVLAIAAVALVSVMSLSISRVDISLVQALEVVWNHITGNVPLKSEDYSSWWIDQIVINDNAPRTIAGICVGAILSVCGAMMQSVTRNPLTDPYTLGISSAAMFGTTIAIVMGICIVPGLDGTAAQIANAFFFSLIPAMAVVLVSCFKRTTPTMMILVGIATMYLFNAFTTFIKFNADADAVEEIYEWGLGTLVKVDWTSMVPLIVTVALLTVLAMSLANRINVISAGDAYATSLGERSVIVRIVCFILISVAVAVAVCFTGTIGFVGLVGPHVARLFVGSNCKVLIPFSAIIGALMVVGADVLVRSLPHVLPVGVVTALIGSPLFLYFLYVQRRKSVW